MVNASWFQQSHSQFSFNIDTTLWWLLLIILPHLSQQLFSGWRLPASTISVFVAAGGNAIDRFLQFIHHKREFQFPLQHPGSKDRAEGKTKARSGWQGPSSWHRLEMAVGSFQDEHNANVCLLSTYTITKRDIPFHTCSWQGIPSLTWGPMDEDWVDRVA